MGEEKKRTAREIIENYDGAAVRIMEVCGTHTHEIFRLGIRKLLPPQVELISGPGCPVCVTPVSFIDEAIYLALEKGVTICTFGDLVRVPGTKMSLAGAREQGAKIRSGCVDQQINVTVLRSLSSGIGAKKVDSPQAIRRSNRLNSTGNLVNRINHNGCSFPKQYMLIFPSPTVFPGYRHSGRSDAPGSGRIRR